MADAKQLMTSAMDGVNVDNAGAIIDHIDVWTNAIKKRNATGRGSNKKIELTGIKKLRELILELAVRGKLVPQDANDEPASVLLEKIAKEKAQLIADKKIKKQKPLPAITNDERLFNLPLGWEWVRLQSIIQISSGKALTSKQMNKEGKVPVYGGNGVTGFHETQNVDKRTLVIGRVGFYCGSVHTTPQRAWVTDNAFITSFSEENIDIDYLSWLLKATDLNENDNATAQPVISGRNLYPIIVCFPPLAEQRRIVGKIDELMFLCDQLEQQTEQSLSAHQTLVEVLLSTLTKGTLTDSDNAESFQTSWQRIAEHFDVLFSTEHSIEQLKQTILQLAVMGKLVPQNPSDEPASVLLEKIAEEKALLIADKKIKKQKILPAISDEEKPFELTKGWTWCKFGEVVNFKAELVKPDNYQLFDQVAPDSIEKGTGRLLSRRTVKESGVKGPNSRFYTGQLLYSKIRPSLSKAIIAEFDGLCSADMYPLESMIDSKYLLKIILSEVFLVQVRKAENRIKMPKLNIDSLSNIIIPVAPVTEQHSIVAKVDALMALCDQLKARLIDAQTTQLHLSDAVVTNALSNSLTDTLAEKTTTKVIR